MQRNIRIFSIYKLFSYDTLFYYAISIIYLASVKNLTLAQIALASCMYSGISIIAQIPASIVTDKIGLKNSMIIGNIFCLIWSILMILAPNFNYILFAQALSAIGFALKGVAESPFLYSSLKSEGRASEFAKIEGKGSSLYFIFEAISCVISGYLFRVNVYLPIICSGICSLISIVLSFYAKPIKIKIKEKLPIKEKFNEFLQSFKFIFKSKRLHALLIFSALFYGVISLSIINIKVYLNGLNISSTAFGYIFAISAVASAIGSVIQEKIEKKNRNKTLSTISITYIITFLIIGFSSLLITNSFALMYIGIIIYIIQSIIKGTYKVIIKDYVSRYTTSSIRPKLMSVYYLAENFGSAILLYISSLVVDNVSIGINYCLSGLMLFVLLILILNYMDSRVGLHPSKYTERDRFDLKKAE